MTILISSKLGFKVKAIQKKGGHSITIKIPAHWADIIMTNSLRLKQPQHMLKKKKKEFYKNLKHI